MVTRRMFLRSAGLGALALVGSGAARAKPVKRPRNVLLITLDDMNWDSLGVTGCTIPGISPHLDGLASEGVLFNNAYIMTSICGPSRNAMMTGRFPHCSGSMGHGQQPPAGWTPPAVATPSLSTYLHERGFYTGAILKSGRLLDVAFDVRISEGPMGCFFEDRHPASFHERCATFLKEAKARNQPFFLYANPIDPHRPFPRTQMERDLVARYREDFKDRVPKPNVGLPEPDTQYGPDEIDLPAFLPDIPEARAHVAPYFDAVHRGDQCVGAILRALKESGLEDDTLVLFLSDHGMGVPGAKWSSYNYSLRTPLMVRWPGVTKPGLAIDNYLVSSIDILPTVIEALGLPRVKGIEGRSLAPLLRGKRPRRWRESVYAGFNYTADSTPTCYYPIRVELDGVFLYIWNAYTQVDGAPTEFHYAQHELLQVMRKHEDPRLRRRAETFTHRPPEELYDIRQDPGCWDNLARGPRHGADVARLRGALRRHMKDTRDPLCALYGEHLESTRT